MPQNIKILIVDDHPFIIQGYENVIKRFPNKKYEFTIIEGDKKNIIIIGIIFRF